MTARYTLEERLMTRFTPGALFVGFVCLWTSAATAQSQAPPGELTDEIAWKCSQTELTVWGVDHDLALKPGETDWTYVADNHVRLFCGTYEDEVECPSGTDFVWVSRTGKWEVFVACYERE